MKLILLFFSLSVSISMFSQTSFTEDNAKKIIDTFFEGFHEGDTLKMKSVIDPKIITQTVFSTTDGQNKIMNDKIENLLKAIAERPETQKWEERLLDYVVQIDGNLAHVWTPYEFWHNDAFSHCGANAFTLAKTDDGWKIVHLIDSRRRSSCEE